MATFLTYIQQRTIKTSNFVKKISKKTAKCVNCSARAYFTVTLKFSHSVPKNRYEYGGIYTNAIIMNKGNTVVKTGIYWFDYLYY
ncbi:hypothetical protein OKW22_000466 [Bacilli bacterium PM5-3]|nr:hypothetical protein [Bacilli bacterium PM5-3]MDH6603750.1 hypothetical protein [Bacilli bacterium PM5-9]